MIRVHTAQSIHEFPQGNRFSTEEDFNNLCVWNAAELLGVFADGQWVLVEFADA